MTLAKDSENVDHGVGPMSACYLSSEWRMTGMTGVPMHTNILKIHLSCHDFTEFIVKGSELYGKL